VGLGDLAWLGSSATGTIQGWAGIVTGVPIRFHSMGQASPQIAEFSSKEAVLGLVIMQPDNSYRLGQRLDKLLSAAQYGRGTAEKATKTLAAEGFIRPIAGQTAHKVYEATPAGVEHFRSWLRASTSMPPMREELHAKIALCEPQDLPLMIGSVREIEMACVAELQTTNRRTQRERLIVGEHEWRQRMGVMVTAGEAAWWDGRIKWLQGLRLCLEQEWQHYQAEQASSRSG
jgi:DNA-binding PadR family transcriptional regulator